MRPLPAFAGSVGFLVSGKPAVPMFQGISTSQSFQISINSLDEWKTGDNNQ
jgi:hypothetical protein